MILVLQAGHPHEADSFIVLGTWERGRLDMRNAPVLYAGQDAAAGIGMAVGIANGAQDPSFGHRGSPSEAGISPPPLSPPPPQGEGLLILSYPSRGRGS